MVILIPSILDGIASETLEKEITDLSKSMGLKPRTIVLSRFIQIVYVSIILGLMIFPMMLALNLMG